jgi:GAF domain-containing protein/ligand-binding sensor protein/anti-sigma regulatory factor (Ser/Thr protein kinase)
MNNARQISEQDIAMWQKIMDTIKQITRFEAHVINMDGSEVTKAQRRCDFCDLLRSTGKGNSLCDRDNIENARKAVTEGRPVQYLCRHAGQVNYAIPIQIAGQRRICLIGEHVLVESPDLDKYRQLARDIGVDPEELVEAVKKLPVKPSREHEENKEIIENLLAKVEELVALNEIARIINDIPYLPDRLSFILDKALDFLQVSFGVIQLVDEDRGVLKIAAERSLRGDRIRELEIGTGITGWVAETGKVALVPNVLKDGRYVQFSDAVKSELAAPMKHAGKVIGVLDIESNEFNAFKKRDRELLMAFAEQAAVAISNARMLEELEQRRTFEQMGFREIYDAISRDFELDGVLNLIMRKASQLLHFDYGCILLIEKDELVTRCSYNLTAAEQTWRTPVGKGITGWVAENRKHLNVADVRREPRFIEVEKGVFSELAVPLIFREDVLGVFDINSTSTDAFSEEDVRQLSLFADQAAMAIGIAQLSHDLRLLDGLRRGSAVAHKYAKKLSGLWEMSRTTIKVAKLEEILGSATNTVMDILDAEACSIFLYNTDTGNLILRATRGLPQKLVGIASYDLGTGLIGHAVSIGESVRLEDGPSSRLWVGRYSEDLKNSVPSRDIKAVLFTPILLEDETLGVISVVNKKLVSGETKPVFSEQDQQMLEILCSQIAIVIKIAEFRKRADDISERQMSHLSIVHELGATLSETMDFSKLLEQTVELVPVLLKAEGCSIFLMDTRRKKLTLEATTGLQPTTDYPIEYEVGEGLTGWVAKHGRTLRLVNLDDPSERQQIAPDLQWSDKYRETLKDRSISKQFLGAPLKFRDETIGVIRISNKVNGRRFTEHDEDLLLALANLIVVFIKSAELRQRTSALFDMNELITSTLDVHKVLDIIMEKACSMLGAARGNVRLVDQKTNELMFRATYGPGWTDEMKLIHYKEGMGIGSHVIETKQPYVCNDVKDDPYYFELFPDVKSHLAVPLAFRGKLLGVLSIDSNEPNAFSKQHVEIMSILGAQAAIAIENARLYTKTSALYEIGRTLSQTLDVQDMLDTIVRKVAELFDSKLCSLFLRDEERNSFVLRASLSLPEELLGVAEYYEGEGLTGWVAKHGKILRLVVNTKSSNGLAEYAPDLYWKGKYKEFRGKVTVFASLTAPMKAGGRTLGVIRLNRPKPKPFTSDDEDLLNVITGHISIAIQNAQLLTDLRKADEMKTNFIASMTHDLKNPLSQVGLYAAVLKEGVEDSEKHQRYLDIIDDEVNRYRAMIDNLMYISKQEATEIRMPKTELIAQDIVRNSVNLHRLMAQDKQVKIKTKLPEHPVRMLGNAELLRQAMDNLIHNAIKYNFKGGTVGISLTDESGKVTLSVRDTGPGIAEEDKARIFEKFFQRNVSDVEVEEKSGAGLGLFIVKSIIEQHGGDVDFQSEVGKGTTFHVVLPKQGDQLT